MSTPPLERESDSVTTLEGEGFSAKVVVSTFNDRLQVVEYRAENTPALAKALAESGQRAGFGKVFMKARAEDREGLEAGGMVREAVIPGYFAGGDAAVMAHFLTEERTRRPFFEDQEDILDAVRERPPDAAPDPLPAGYQLVVARREDLDDLAALYRTVFASYPYPIRDPAFLTEAISDNTVYAVIRNAEGDLVAAASAEMDLRNGNAEMTDFATLPSQRGLGLAKTILVLLEDDMERRGIRCLYTIARARSFGMNRVFHNLGYVWSGTLVNNCHIAGQFEDMHVWYKNRASRAR